MESKQYGRRTARCAGWASPACAYHKKEAGEPGISAGQTSVVGGLPSVRSRMQGTPLTTESLCNNDDSKRADVLQRCRSMGGKEIRFGSVNVGTMTKRSGEITEMISRKIGFL